MQLVLLRSRFSTTLFALKQMYGRRYRSNNYIRRLRSSVRKYRNLYRFIKPKADALDRINRSSNGSRTPAQRRPLFAAEEVNTNQVGQQEEYAAPFKQQRGEGQDLRAMFDLEEL